jgi:hypothetical protein
MEALTSDAIVPNNQNSDLNKQQCKKVLIVVKILSLFFLN